MKDIITIKELGKVIKFLEKASSAHSEMMEGVMELIKRITKENAELYDQLTDRESSHYKSLDQAITDLVGDGCNPDLHYFHYNERIRLKYRPDVTGTVKGFSIAWFRGEPLAVHDVLLDHFPESMSMPVAAYCLESLPEADDQKQ